MALHVSLLIMGAQVAGPGNCQAGKAAETTATEAVGTPAGKLYSLVGIMKHQPVQRLDI
jgi:hypothetical protein